MSPSPQRLRIAVILAAGAGKRLAGIFGNKPKGMLEIGGEPIIVRSLDQLKRQDIQHTVIIVGYQAVMLMDLLGEHDNFVSFVLNPDFEETGSMHSLYTARDALGEDFLLLESDLVYEERALKVLCTAGHSDTILASGWTGSGDEVYVYGGNGRISAISKNVVQGLQARGELVGISRISYPLYRKMCAFHKQNYEVSSRYHYEECLSDLSSHHSIHYLKIDGLAWAEIDDLSQYRRATHKIYPLILERDGE